MMLPGGSGGSFGLRGSEIEGDLSPEEVAFHAVGGLEFVEPFDFGDEVGLSEFTDP